MPIVTIEALISADTGLGASGCARGSQACSGRRPAFEPKPITVSRNTAVRVPAETESARAARVAKSSAPPAAESTTRATRIATNPSCVMTAYTIPADRTAARRWSASTSASDAAAISSQHSRNVVTVPAAGTRTMPATNVGSMASVSTDQCSWRAYPTA